MNAEEKLSISQEEGESKSLAAFERVLKNGPKIELDHHIVYYTRMSGNYYIISFDRLN